jgi:hypothetical protein
LESALNWLQRRLRWSLACTGTLPLIRCAKSKCVFVYGTITLCGVNFHSLRLTHDFVTSRPAGRRIKTGPTTLTHSLGAFLGSVASATLCALRRSLRALRINDPPDFPGGSPYTLNRHFQRRLSHPDPRRSGCFPPLSTSLRPKPRRRIRRACLFFAGLAVTGPRHPYSAVSRRRPIALRSHGSLERVREIKKALFVAPPV